MHALKQLLARTPLYRPARAVRRIFRSQAERRREAEVLAFYRAVVSPGALAFDIGANVGHVAEPLLRAGARVVAVEPQPGCVAQLRANCGHRRRLTVVQAVVGRAAGTATLHLRPHHASSSLRADWLGHAVGTLRVPMVTLASLVERHGSPDYLKIDVEGVEEEVLATLPHPLPLVSFEYLRDELGRVAACLEMVAPDGRGEVNLTLPGPLRFALPAWMPLDEFRATMADRLAGPGAPAWGDVWVRRAG
jgi:FkbM family methyltransferase